MTGKILQAAFALLFCLTATTLRAATADAEPKVLVLKFADATTADFLFADTPVITFGDGKVVVSSTNGQAEYDEAQVVEYYFAETPTGITENTVGQLSLRYTDNTHVTVSGTRATQAQLYDLSGRLVKSQPVSGGSVSVDLSGCAQGTYILNLVNDHSFKIIKK